MRNRNERAELIRAVSQGGETVRAAATRLGVPMSTAQRWVRIAAAASSPTPKPRFVEAVVDRVEPPMIRVRVGVAQLEVRAGFDARLLREVAAALGDDA
jgi:transposase-like protein